MQNRTLSAVDIFIGRADQALRLMLGPPRRPERPSPARNVADGDLTSAERERVARLMRVNHAGEICAQALYHGQSITARTDEAQKRLEQAALEENDHLAWCDERVHALGSHTSRLNPFWYAGSFAIGMLAGAAGDRWNLGFLAETERQVVVHLDGHLKLLPAADHKSRAIVEQMRADEGAHATAAIEAGGADLPGPVATLMRAAARIMTGTAYWI